MLLHLLELFMLQLNLLLLTLQPPFFQVLRLLILVFLLTSLIQLLLHSSLLLEAEG